MREYKLGEVCERGSLARQCPICERDEEIAELKATIAKIDNVTLWNVSTVQEAEFLDKMKAKDEEIAKLREEVRLKQGAINATAERERTQGLRVGIIAGCDTLEEMADDILKLREDLANECVLRAAAETQVEMLKKEKSDILKRVYAAWDRGLDVAQYSVSGCRAILEDQNMIEKENSMW